MIDYSTVLHKGCENAVTSADLVKQLGFSSDRALRKDIERARESGQLIMSSKAGYYLPSSRDEAMKFYRSMKSHAITVFRSLKSTRKYLNEVYGQMNVDDIQEAANETHDS